MPQTKLFKYESKGAKPATKTLPRDKESPKLSAFAQEFHPTDASEPELSEPLDFQDFPLTSYDYESYDYNPYYDPSAEYPVEFDSDRKPLRECDKLDGLDFSTFLVFANVKNIPLEMNVADPVDGPGRLRLCAYGYECHRRTLDCPFTHIKDEDGSWNMSDENWPSAPKDGDKESTQKKASSSSSSPTSSLSSFSSLSSGSPSPVSTSVQPTSPSYPPASPHKKHFLPPSLSFVSTISLASTLSSYSSHDSSPTSFSDSPPDSPPDSPTTSSSTPDSPRLKKWIQHQNFSNNLQQHNKKFRPVKVSPNVASAPATTATTRSSWVPTKVGVTPPATTNQKTASSTVTPTASSSKPPSGSVSGLNNNAQRKNNGSNQIAKHTSSNGGQKK